MYRYLDIRTNPHYKYDQVLGDINYNFSLISGGTFTGGTVLGPTVFTVGLSATSISATTYFGLPLDVYVTGGTYSAGTTTLNRNDGGAILITGYSTLSASTFTGGTISGLTTFTGGLSANNISATTYYGDGSNLTGIITNSSIARTFMFMGG